MSTRLTLCFAVLIPTVGLALPAAAREPIIFSFEDPDSPLNESWVPSPLDGGPQNVKITDENSRRGIRSLKLYGRLPDGFGVMYKPWRDWTGYATLSLDVWLPKSVEKVGDVFNCLVYIKDRSYYWFETPLYKDPKTKAHIVPVVGGKWTHFDLDISEASTIWIPGGHKRSWDHALRKPREFGLRFFSRKPWAGAVYVDNIKLSGEDMPLGKRDAPQFREGPRPQREVALEAAATSVPVYEKLELTFQLDTRYENPFDPEVVDVQGHFLAPSGETISVPGFYYQSYDRSLTEEGFEKLTPVGAPCWKVRFAPKEQGEYTYRVTVADALGKIEAPRATFTATAPLEPQGYVRVGKTDPHYFEFENGDWFYPLGINMRDGGDDASKQKGTYDFDYYCRRFQEEGVNLVRTWMCSWWAGIEWSDEYHSRFDDVGRYNTYNAWRLDYLVDLARQRDLFLEVTFNSHGQLRRDKYDEEWTYSPWNIRNGGYVASPAMFFSSERVKQDFRNRYRYIVARWGYSRNIMSWDLWNEIDLAEGYNEALVAAWHKEMAGYLKSIDPWKHIVLTHICLFWSHGNELWKLPEIEAVQSDAYWHQKKDKRADMGMFLSYWGKTLPDQSFKPRYDKPFLFIEYGPLYASVANKPPDPAVWRHHFRTGMWTSAVLPTAGPAVFWYHKEWDEQKLYRYQKPLMKLFGDYDRRGRDFRLRCSAPRTKSIVLLGASTLRAIGMLDEKDGFLYCHNPRQMGVADRAQVRRPIQGAQATVLSVPEGEYDVAFIDTLTGEITGATQAKVEKQGGDLKFDLPAIADDLLVKFTRR